MNLSKIARTFKLSKPGFLSVICRSQRLRRKILTQPWKFRYHAKTGFNDCLNSSQSKKEVTRFCVNNFITVKVNSERLKAVIL